MLIDDCPPEYTAPERQACLGIDTYHSLAGPRPGSFSSSDPEKDLSSIHPEKNQPENCHDP
jgi:hypothetical protein